MEVHGQKSMLPARLMDNYRTGKQDTYAVIRWMCSRASLSRHRCTSINAVDELSFLADRILEKDIHIPASVVQTLKSAVRARTRLSKHFEALQGDTIRIVNKHHQYFNGVLGDVYDRIRSKARTATFHESSLYEPPIDVSNKFGCLHTLKDHLSCDVTAISPSTTPHGRSGTTRRICAPRKDTVQNGRDPVPDIQEEAGRRLGLLNTFLQRFECLLRTSSHHWSDAATGSSGSTLSATIVTNVALELVAKYEKNLHALDVFEPDQLASSLGNATKPFEYLEDTSKHQMHLATAHSIRRVWHQLLRFRSSWLASIDASKGSSSACAQCSMAPHDDIPQLLACAEDDSADDAYLKCVLQRMVELIAFNRTESGITINIRVAVERAPMVKLLSLFLLERYRNQTCESVTYCPECSVPGFALCFGLLAIKESTSAVYAQQKSKVQSCRLQTLFLAYDFKRSLTSLTNHAHAPCECLRIQEVSVTGEINIETARVTKFLATKRFDAFHQSPWIAGADALEMLVNNVRCGWQSWHHAYFVGQALHLYNCLVLLGVISTTEIPLLEQLCDILAEEVFLGARPQRSLWATFQRWKGGRIDRQKRKRPSNSSACDPQQACKRWQLKCPVDASQGGNNEKRRFAPEKKSFVVALSVQSYRLEERLWADMPTHRNRLQLDHHEDGEGGSRDLAKIRRALESIKEDVQQEINERLPLPRLDPYAVYRLCVDILSAIDRREHSESDGYICPCAVERLLCATDTAISKHQCTADMIHETALLGNGRKAFLETTGNRSIEDFCWKSELFG